MSLLIRGGRVVDPASGLDAVRDVLIRDGRIAEIGESLPTRDTEIVDASGAIVAPGFIDMHVHLREPGQTHKETIATGSAAAVLGGFTAVACMPNTEPALDTAARIAYVVELGRAANLARVYPIGAITQGRAGDVLAPYHAMHAAGAVAWSDDGATVANARVLRDAALAALDVAGPMISHCEDADLKGDAVLNESTTSLALGLPASSSLSEEVIVARDVTIAASTTKAFHIAHVSSKRSVDLIRFARSIAAPVTCEVTPHHLLLSDEAWDGYTANAKVNPPLLGGDNVRALRDAVRDGTIDVFASDHAPHTTAEKEQLVSVAPVGFTGLEVAVGAYAAALPDLPLARFVGLISTNPARILGIAGGTLAIGAPADITIFADRAWTVDTRTFASKGRVTPFAGMSFPRRAIATIVAGRLVARDGRLTESP